MRFIFFRMWVCVKLRVKLFGFRLTSTSGDGEKIYLKWKKGVSAYFSHLVSLKITGYTTYRKSSKMMGRWLMEGKVFYRFRKCFVSLIIVTNMSLRGLVYKTNSSAMKNLEMCLMSMINDDMHSHEQIFIWQWIQAANMLRRLYTLIVLANFPLIKISPTPTRSGLQSLLWAP